MLGWMMIEPTLRIRINSMMFGKSRIDLFQQKHHYAIVIHPVMYTYQSACTTTSIYGMCGHGLFTYPV